MVSRPGPIALLVASLLSIAPTASADVIYAFGQTALVDDPDPFFYPVDPPQAYFEAEATLNSPLYVNDIAVGLIGDDPSSDEVLCDAVVEPGRVQSHFVFQNPPAATTNADVLIFSGPILGLVHQSTCMSDYSDAFFARAGMTPPAVGGLGLTPMEGDLLALLVGRRTVFHQLVARGADDWDGYRVITVAPQAVADVRLACTPFPPAVEASDVVEITLTPSNMGPDIAVDPQIVFRIPDGAQVTRIEGPYACTDSSHGRIQVCLLERELPMGAGPELRVVLEFLETPVVDRFVAFGSGAVEDVDLSNNECDRRVFGPDVPDGAVLDADVPRDGAPGVDTGGRPPPSGGPALSFRGAGGCACDVGRGGPSLPSWWFGLALVLMASFRGSRRR